VRVTTINAINIKADSSKNISADSFKVRVVLLLEPVILGSREVSKNPAEAGIEVPRNHGMS
jgi:hypothetical protein